MSTMPNHPKGNSGSAGAGDLSKEPPVPELRLVSPDDVAPNPQNPRLIFPQREIEELAESIEQIGVQVPITVYSATEGVQPPYVLLDGERRWRAAKLINLTSIPASIVSRPDGTENMVRMFNIHMLRESWKDMPTAWALEQLIQDTGIQSPTELQRLTGLSVDQVRNIKIVLSYPRDVQEAVAQGELKYNALIELWKATNILRRTSSENVLGLSADEVQEEFMERVRQEEETDVVQFRKLGRLISTALEESVAGEAAKEALATLMSDRDVTIEEAYEAGAASSIELSNVLRDLDRLPRRLERVFRTGLHADQAASLRQAILRLNLKLGELLAKE